MDGQVIEKTLTTEEAARLLRGAGIKIQTVTLRQGIEQGKFPFGICIEKDIRVFIISKKKFCEWCLDFFGVDFSSELMASIPMAGEATVCGGGYYGS